MTFSRAFSAIAGVLGLGVLVSPPAYSQSTNLAMDVPARISGIQTVCTGVSADARDNPLWSNYALKVEFAGEGGMYLADERVTLRQNGKDILSLFCAGPWVLFQLPPGRYNVEGEVAGRLASSAVFVPQEGQGRVVLRFPNTESGPAPYAMNYSDEAARTLGIEDGRIDAFSVQPAPDDKLAPTIKGGADKKGAGLELQWKTD